jgi:hypothetical protein
MPRFASQLPLGAAAMGFSTREGRGEAVNTEGCGSHLLSLRQSANAGRHRIWGGLAEAERAGGHQHWLAGVSVVTFLEP